jgi:hypothetical protein
MKRQITLAGAAVACLSLSACASANTGKLLENLQGCERHYDGVVSAGIANTGFSGSIKVDCLPSKPAPVVEPSSPPGGT